MAVIARPYAGVPDVHTHGNVGDLLIDLESRVMYRCDRVVTLGRNYHDYITIYCREGANVEYVWREVARNVEDVMTYILVDEAGNEIPAVLVDEEVVFTATANDIRSGTVAATADGVTVGEKEIPAYYTTEGVQLVTAGSEFRIRIQDSNRYEYTKLQAIICPINTTVANSVAAEKVCINDNIYVTGDTTSLATVTLDHGTKEIVLGIVNDTNKLFVIRYFSYKEEE